MGKENFRHLNMLKMGTDIVNKILARIHQPTQSTVSLG